ncbi:hypothetical protein HRG84_02750 [Flavisolibacter sp. BT320]|nr:hypothetical protein [Flavisolibacter longurius]
MTNTKSFYYGDCDADGWIGTQLPVLCSKSRDGWPVPISVRDAFLLPFAGGVSTTAQRM